MNHFVGRAAGAALLPLAIAAFTPTAVSGQGSAVYTQSACMNARNGAGIAAPCEDGSAVYYNPAALARQNGAVSVGITMIDQSGSFIYDTTGVEIEREPSSVPVPHGWASYRLSPTIGVGLGVWAPYGLSLDWPVCPVDQARCGIGFEGRFVSYDQNLRGLYLQPTVAWDVLPGRLAIGAGVDIVRGEVEINRRVDLSRQPIELGPGYSVTFSTLGIQRNTDFADVKLAGDGWGFTGHVGALLDLTDAISIGARYMHSVELDMEGTADFTQVPTRLTIGPLGGGIPAGTSLDELLVDAGTFEEGGAAADQPIATSLTLPAQAVAGIAIELDPTLRIMFDYQWTQWSVWDSIVVSFDNGDDQVLILDYEDATTLRFGADYVFSDRITLRGGVTVAEPAATEAAVSPFLPDSDRTYFSGGLSFRASERLSLDVFAMALNSAARRGRVVDRTSFEQTAEQLNEGLYTSDGQLFGATLTYRFGGPR